MHSKTLFLFILFISPFISIGQISFNVPFNSNQQLGKKFVCSLDSIHKHKKKKANEGFFVGANLGFYHANPNTAQFYNGSGIHGSGNVDTTIFSTYNHPILKQALNDDSFNLAELPAKMHYSISFYFRRLPEIHCIRTPVFSCSLVIQNLLPKMFLPLLIIIQDL